MSERGELNLKIGSLLGRTTCKTKGKIGLCQLSKRVKNVVVLLFSLSLYFLNRCRQTADMLSGLLVAI